MGASSDAVYINGQDARRPHSQDGCATDLARVVRLHAVLAQFPSQRGQVLAVACLHRTKDVHRRDIRAGKSAIVHHLLDAGTAGSDLCGQICETAGPIANHGGEARKSSVGDESALDDPAQDIRIDISAAKQKHDAFAGETFLVSG